MEKVVAFVPFLSRVKNDPIVIVQFPDESIYLLCKGAESTVLPKCVAGSIDETEQHIKDYAMVKRIQIFP
jgi:magnesium-transporting ATPase (P-type)